MAMATVIQERIADQIRERFGDRLAATVPETAEALSISHGHTKNLIASGEILSVKIGDSRRVLVAAIQRILTEGAR